ncbi:PREDICTED: dual specificity protein phosphatase 18-like [Mesitornis unicolor]|uniref:dual specificity protein phosphatase 18-like n=1 Tax=Mesitornis unicolor TaxID=54374 RepID=UPI000528F087|nr:PREDICTED: dual specificity protein phosphatase 18-like [Mesitornis unicolor]
MTKSLAAQEQSAKGNYSVREGPGLAANRFRGGGISVCFSKTRPPAARHRTNPLLVPEGTVGPIPGGMPPGTTAAPQPLGLPGSVDINISLEGVNIICPNIEYLHNPMLDAPASPAASAPWSPPSADEAPLHVPGWPHAWVESCHPITQHNSSFWQQRIHCEHKLFGSKRSAFHQGRCPCL